MSAAIVQKNTTTSVYFERGDIYKTNKIGSENKHIVLHRVNAGTAGGGGGAAAAAAAAAATATAAVLKELNSVDKHNNNLINASDILLNATNKVVQQPQQQQQEQHHKMDIPKQQHHLNDDYLLQQQNQHTALTRAVSQPQPTYQPDSNITSLVPLIENLNPLKLHRKLERTQSEPLPQQQVNTSRYKTELCRPFEEAGECKYGEKCQFAHGYHELRNLQRHPKYKTEYCRTFHSVGFCPYGPRCHFVHNADEARGAAQQQQQSAGPTQGNKPQSQQQPQQKQTHSNFDICMTNNSNNNNNNHNSNNNKMNATGNGNVNGGSIMNNHSLPLSPPLSMSTGSDRESPTGSLSLSPTSSLHNFPFGEQISPANSVFQSTVFSYSHSTPPESPNASMSPVNTPPPQPSLALLNSTSNLQHHHVQLNNNNNNINSNNSADNQHQLYIKSISLQSGGAGGKQLLTKSCSTPIGVHKSSNNKNKSSATMTAPSVLKVSSASSLNNLFGDDARLPVFNRLSMGTGMDSSFSNLAL